MKQVPKTPEAYARYLYMADQYHPASHDGVIVGARVKAFVDGVNWQKRRAVRERALRKPKRR